MAPVQKDNSRSGGPRAAIDRAWLRLVRAYTFNTPISRGRHRAYLFAMRFSRHLPTGEVVSTHDGRKLYADLTTGMQTTVFFLGEYEKAITEIVVKLAQAGKCRSFLDVGANFGWYTTLFQRLTANLGEVHSFEPVPPIFANLKKNFELMGSPANVHINNLALGDERKEITINLFSGLSTGHASISNHGRDDAVPHVAQMNTLDNYLAENAVGEIDFVKVDIEGAEMSFLNGATTLFKQKVPPVFLMEMALNQTRDFGYEPNALIDRVNQNGDYKFFWIDEIAGKLVPFEHFPDGHIGANVICIPDRCRDSVMDAAQLLLR